ncbi:DNA_pol_A_exo1 domain-containing protein [Cephalotus follicularis]|uniref:DNA_pol_A_exo1 domain-containing protein n=1 Tax=Cephalotus follicularis TaxID=3775 RepID=A0A1Q3CLT3_CEPFO|nr:DNA_pol_A_exo1 domain-containing protein [Cephalotus follicularis]
MSITIFDHQLSDYSHDLYTITLDDNFHIETLLTHCPSMVDSWLTETQRIHRRRLHHLIVGLDVEWRPSYSCHRNPIATLQLCVGHRCLLFQIMHSPYVPQSLIQFLENDCYTFVGVGIAQDVEKLEDDYGLLVGNAVDLRELDVDAGLRNSGLKALAWNVLGIDVEKPKSVTMSRWDDEWLTTSQVSYASVDAFLSFEIGRRLNASR